MSSPMDTALADILKSLEEFKFRPGQVGRGNRTLDPLEILHHWQSIRRRALAGEPGALELLRKCQLHIEAGKTAAFLS